MDNYEVNVLTRKGGWKKLPQEMSKDEKKDDIDNNLSIEVKDINEDEFSVKNENSNSNNLFEKFSNINSIIKKLKSLETEKNELLIQLDNLEENFEARKNKLDLKIDDIKKEYDLYGKAIDLIKSLKKV